MIVRIGLFTRFRRQEFQVGKFATPGNRFTLTVYGVIAEVKAIAGDTPVTIAGRLANLINSISYPITLYPYRIRATTAGDIIKLELDYQHEFIGAAYET